METARLYRASEVAKILDCSKSLVNNLMRDYEKGEEGGLPFVKIRSMRRIPSDCLERFIESNLVCPEHQEPNQTTNSVGEKIRKSTMSPGQNKNGTNELKSGNPEANESRLERATKDTPKGSFTNFLAD